MKKKILLYIGCALLLVSLCSFVVNKKKQSEYDRKAQEFKKLVGYEPYQVLMWYTMSKEGYRDHWYPDGKVWVKKDGKRKKVQSYSIGFGINDHGNSDYHDEITKRICDKNGNVIFEKAVAEIKYYFDKHPCRVKTKDLFKEIAIRLHQFNRGSCTVAGKVDRCCGRKHKPGCGANLASHIERRGTEEALATRDICTFIENFEPAVIEVQQLRSKYK